MYPAFKSGIYSGKRSVQDGIIITSWTFHMMANVFGYQDDTTELAHKLIEVIKARTKQS